MLEAGEMGVALSITLTSTTSLTHQDSPGITSVQGDRTYWRELGQRREGDADGEGKRSNPYQDSLLDTHYSIAKTHSSCIAPSDTYRGTSHY